MNTKNMCVIIGALVILFDWKASVEGIWTCNKGNNTETVKREVPRITGKDLKVCKLEHERCSADSECCSGICQRSGMCGCRRFGETCDVDTDCCSLVCVGGDKKCGYKRLEDSCLLPKQCHPGTCTRIEDNFGFKTCTECRQGGEDCGSGSNLRCCKRCDDDDKCALGKPGDVCSHDSHCESQPNFAGENATVTCVNNRCDCDSTNLPCQINFDCCLGFTGQTCSNSTKLCE